jgi:phage shock protein PspC (stress-responsive transcriptional regulator)
MGNKKIAGVCSGIARYFHIDVTLVRVLFIAGLLLHGITLLAYVILWVAMPRDDERRVYVQTV